MHWQQLSDNLSDCSYSLIISLLISVHYFDPLQHPPCSLGIRRLPSIFVCILFVLLLCVLCRQVCNCLVFRGFRIIIIIIIVIIIIIAAAAAAAAAVVMAFPCQNHSTNSPYSSSSIYSYQRDKRAKRGILTKSSALSEIGEH